MPFVLYLPLLGYQDDEYERYLRKNLPCSTNQCAHDDSVFLQGVSVREEALLAFKVAAPLQNIWYL